MKPSDKSTPRTADRRARSKRIALMLTVIGAAAIFAAYEFYQTATSPRANPASRPASRPVWENDARLRKLVVGTWADEYKGRRTMTIRPDGTATMIVELDGLKAMMFASRLRFDMVWSVEAGRLKKRTVGGEPPGRVRLILATMGDRVDEPILELTDRRLLLLDGDGQTKYDWRRVDNENPADSTR